MSRISIPAMAFVGALLALTVLIWIASARGAWLPTVNEESEFSLRDVESHARRHTYHSWGRHGK